MKYRYIYVAVILVHVVNCRERTLYTCARSYFAVILQICLIHTV